MEGDFKQARRDQFDDGLVLAGNPQTLSNWTPQASKDHNMKYIQKVKEAKAKAKAEKEARERGETIENEQPNEQNAAPPDFRELNK